MGVKVTGQFEPAGDFSIVDGKDVSGNITGSNISSSGQIEAASIGTNLASIISGSTPFDAAAVSGSLGSNATLIRSLTAAGISGSFTSVSSSIASRLTTEEGNVDTLQARDLIAGAGLTGGGTLAADRTFNIGAGTGITVNANDIAVSAAQTSITSIINNFLGKIGTADNHPTAAYITFGTSNEINTFINNSERLSVRNGGIDVTGVITSTGNISGSSTSTGSFGAGYIDNKLGLGIKAPISPLHIYQDNSTTDTTNGITIENDGTGDAILQYLLTGTKRWITGIDNSDSDKFKFAYSADVGSGNALELDTSGNVVAVGTITSESSVSRPVQSDETDPTPIRNIRRMTQSAYDAITPDANTLYIIE